MKEIILVKYGEIILKGLNRSNFEDALIKNMRRRLKNLGDFTIRKAQSTIYFEPASDDFDFEEADSFFDRDGNEHIVDDDGYCEDCDDYHDDW